MRVVYIDDQDNYREQVGLVVNEVANSLGISLDYQFVSPPTVTERAASPLYLDADGKRLEHGVEARLPLEPHRVVSREVIDRLATVPNSIFLIDVNFGKELIDYGEALARYLVAGGVDPKRISLFTNFPGSARTGLDDTEQPWFYRFDKSQFGDPRRFNVGALSQLLMGPVLNAYFSTDSHPLGVTPFRSSGLVGADPNWIIVLNKAKRVAPTSATVLLLGESGVGKEQLAKAIHKASPRKDKTFIPVNCAALSESLIESELFGHEKGAFTGADRKKLGKFVLADKGTIFLDEVGAMSVDAQAKVLRVLQDGVVDPVGATQVIPVNTRVIAATSADLKLAMVTGKFREDLYYRLAVVEIVIPPLRERPEDIILLANFFVKEASKEEGINVKPLAADAVDALRSYDWPGNVRELKNRITRACILGAKPSIQRADLELPETVSGYQNSREGEQIKPWDVVWREVTTRAAQQRRHPKPYKNILDLIRALSKSIDEGDAESKELLRQLLQGAIAYILRSPTEAQTDYAILAIVEILGEMEAWPAWLKNTEISADRWKRILREAQKRKILKRWLQLQAGARRRGGVEPNASETQLAFTRRVISDLIS